MTSLSKILKAVHLCEQGGVRDFLAQTFLPIRPNVRDTYRHRRLLEYYELIRQSAYRAADDGGSDAALEILQQVRDEQIRLQKARRGDAFDIERFRRKEDGRQAFSEWRCLKDTPIDRLSPLEADIIYLPEPGADDEPTNEFVTPEGLELIKAYAAKRLRAKKAARIAAQKRGLKRKVR